MGAWMGAARAILAGEIGAFQMTTCDETIDRFICLTCLAYGRESGREHFK